MGGQAACRAIIVVEQAVHLLQIRGARRIEFGYGVEIFVHLVGELVTFRQHILVRGDHGGVEYLLDLIQRHYVGVGLLQHREGGVPNVFETVIVAGRNEVIEHQVRNEAEYTQRDGQQDLDSYR